jgi:hypothetical protein
MRPTTIAEIALRAADGRGAFDRSVREFMDRWQTAPAELRREALTREPKAIDPIKDAYLAALAEHLALSEGLIIPQWTENPSRFLSDPFFAGGLESLKAILLVESPLAFRRRLIFISADALSRPDRGFVENPAPSAALDA